jgi:nickel superoxide dismutase
LNQATRWINTKEEHACKIISTVSEYFMTQKMKVIPAKGSSEYAAYLDKLAAHHAVLVAAMGCKQNVDMKTAEKLVAAIQAMQKHYE